MEGVWTCVFFGRGYWSVCVKGSGYLGHGQKKNGFVGDQWPKHHQISWAPCHVNQQPYCLRHSGHTSVHAMTNATPTSILGTAFFFTPFHVPPDPVENLEAKWSSSKLRLVFTWLPAQKNNPKTREKDNPPTCFLEIEDFLRMCRFAPVFHTLFS